MGGLGFNYRDSQIGTVSANGSPPLRTPMYYVDTPIMSILSDYVDTPLSRGDEHRHSLHVRFDVTPRASRNFLFLILFMLMIGF